MDYSRHILALDDAELERFVLRWLQVMTTPKYFSTQRFAGAGDAGRDVVGFLTKAHHEGPWHNYQCKQLVFQTKAAESGSGRLQGSYLQDFFSAPPYGWTKDTLRYLFAALLRAGEVEFHVPGVGGPVRTTGPKRWKPSRAPSRLIE